MSEETFPLPYWIEKNMAKTAKIQKREQRRISKLRRQFQAQTTKLIKGFSGLGLIPRPKFSQCVIQNRDAH
jgi:hypothetical protein